MPQTEPPPLSGATRQNAILIVRDRLREAGVEDALDDARRLALAACKIQAIELLRNPDKPLSHDEASLLHDFTRRRASGEPPSRIVGSRPFWTVDLTVRSDVLDPRADTEAVVRLAKHLMRERAPRSILDLGSGSGALLCALLTEYANAFGVAVDLSSAACRATQENLERCGLRDRASVVRSVWGQALSGGFDLVTSNPPYIPSGDISDLPVEVRAHDPHMALDGGMDGLDAYRAIFRQSGTLLVSGGFLIVEFGANQRLDVEALGVRSGLVARGVERDLGGRDRALAFQAP